jgi:hypothetical protein
VTLSMQPPKQYGVEQIGWWKRPTSYDVTFWEKLTDPQPPTPPMWSEESHCIANAESAADVFAWAEANANGRSFVIDALVTLGERDGLVRLHGLDPTTADHPD